MHSGEDPEIRKLFALALVEGLRQGANANIEEGVTLVQPWGFQLAEIAFDKMFQWHGEQDRIVPVEAARLLAQALPSCTATFYLDDGHLSTFVNHAEEIWRTLSF